MDETPDASDREDFRADLLNGWKEIASFLGKGVRTVQRWEAELGLPIHRLGEKGLIVQARRSEILAWRESAKHAEALEAPAAAASAIEHPPAAPPPTAPRFRATAAFGLSVGLLGAGALMLRLGIPAASVGARPAVANAEVLNGSLRALDHEGRVLWTHRFEVPLEGSFPRSRSTTNSASKLRLVDLDGDGTDEVVLHAALDPTGPATTYVFDATGTLRFQRRPGRPVTFGSKRMQSFSSLDTYSIPHPDGKSQLFVTGNHRAEFGSVLERVDAQGRVLSEYWSNGFITDVKPVTLDGRRFLAVGAFNNEWLGASVALLTMENPSGRAPAANPEFLCTDCPGADPLAFVVFPQSDVLAELTGGQGAAWIWDMQFDEPGHWRVNVRHGELTPLGQTDQHIAMVSYTLNARGFSVEDVYPGPGFVAIHKDLSRAGRLAHTFGTEDSERLGRVLVWRDGRFTTPESRFARNMGRRGVHTQDRARDLATTPLSGR
jgi:hypothetical protein